MICYLIPRCCPVGLVGLRFITRFCQLLVTLYTLRLSVTVADHIDWLPRFGGYPARLFYGITVTLLLFQLFVTPTVPLAVDCGLFPLVDGSHLLLRCSRVVVPHGYCDLLLLGNTTPGVLLTGLRLRWTLRSPVTLLRLLRTLLR